MKLDFTDKLLIFTDGACSGNPGPGGYGTVIVAPDGQVSELGGGSASTTNNRMEMMAIIKGLQKVSQRREDIWILTDSTYVIRGITEWIYGWKKRNWVKSDGEDVSNKDLWQQLDTEVALRKNKSKLEWKYLRGHSGTPGNERCDEIAVSFSKKVYVPLYNGPLLEYPVAIYDIPEDLSLPPAKAPDQTAKKKKAFSYLSYVNGQLERHSTWSECEARVKGRSGAKFKKATSAADEIEIAKSWGANLDSIKGE